MTEMMFRLNWTGLDPFFLDLSGLFQSYHNRQLVVVAVRQNQDKKLDWTRPLNTRNEADRSSRRALFADGWMKGVKESSHICIIPRAYKLEGNKLK